MHQSCIRGYLHDVIAVGRQAVFITVEAHARPVIVEREDMVASQSIREVVNPIPI